MSSATRDLMEQFRQGRVSRRGFVVRMAALGFSASAIAAFLAACGGAATPTTGTTTSTAPSAAPTTAASAAPTAASGGAGAPATATRAGAGATATGAAAASPAVGGSASGLGAVSDRPLGAGGGVGPGSTKRGGGGTLKMLWWQAPTVLNAHLAQGTKDWDASRITYEPLASFGPDDKLVPFLAAEIPSRANGGLAADGTSVTWKLKQGVKWSDGQPFTAKDVVFTWKYVTNTETAAGTIGNYIDIKTVEAIDDNTVKVTFKAATPGWYIPFVGANGYIIPEHVFSAGIGAAAKTFAANLKPVGTGPYRVTDFKPGDTVTYEINPNWRDANGPFFDQIQMKGGGDATSAARAVLQTGDYQVGWNLQIEPSVINQLTANGGKGKLQTTPNWGVERILLNFSDPNKEVNGQRSEKNTPHPFLADKAVRQAFALLCDRKTISDSLYGPTGQPTANLLTNPKPYASTNTSWEFNPAKAEALLDQAGWTKQGQYRAKGGVQMSVLFSTTTNSVRQKHQQIVKDALEKAGIKTELKSVDSAVFFGADPGNPDNDSHFYSDLEMYTTSNTLPDPWTYLQGMGSSDQIAQKENQWSGTNYTRWSNKDYDTLVAQAKSELDEAKRAQLFIKLNDLMVNEVVQIGQVDRLGPQAFANDMKGAELTAWDVTTWNIANWTRG
jgi:peptide/nickel transport system substrate-binding protein